MEDGFGRWEVKDCEERGLIALAELGLVIVMSNTTRETHHIGLPIMPLGFTYEALP